MGIADNKKTGGKKRMVIMYILIQILIYISFMTIDITESSFYITSSFLKFSGILLCFIFTYLFYTHSCDRKDISILRGALFFTVISDLFILILDYYIVGLVTFCIVQSLYLIRLGLWNKKLKGTDAGSLILKNFIRNFVITIIALLILTVVRIKLEGMIIISCFYFISILFNVIDSILLTVRAKDKNKVIFAVSMMLFILCDINVGVFNLSDFICINSKWFALLYSFSTIAMWMFYLPAQVGISLSGQMKK
ncbi:lysoplasmalogenase family protein [Anaerocolumna sp. MB42-C2]|uniref:lysoplasmalogenase family protein n=1 Tax=Anaerocolumna sp. MB42-C2 TaxID=3070997 RepID=UPI0027DFE250|nr:lysoplasmalogenase family protein [Anaerocolumna sp. MB42-C2]WMJ88575.1 lysoplasmalogenase family protein [Anaerocolumna sp. MB42-C2]